MSNEPTTAGAAPEAQSAVFLDRHGRQWDTSLTLLGAQRIDASDFSELFAGEVSMLEPSKEWLGALVQNTAIMAAVCWAIVKPVADEREIDEATFIDGFNGTAVSAMKRALWWSLEDFFQGQGIDLSKLTQTIERAEAKKRAFIESKAHGLQTAIDRSLDGEFSEAYAQLERELGIPSGRSQPRPASAQPTSGP